MLVIYTNSLGIDETGHSIETLLRKAVSEKQAPS
jgi:hypothetical protein